MSPLKVPLKRFCVGGAEYGLNISASEYREDGIRFLRTSDIDEGGSVLDESAVYVDSDLAIETRYRLQPGDLLFSRSGTLGRCLRYRDEFGQSTFAGYLVRFRPSKNADPRYLEYCSQSRFFQSAVQADAITSTISNFNAEKYGGVRCPLWALPEQKAIADYLDAETARIDALIATKVRALDLLSERVSAVVFGGVVGRLTSCNQPLRESGIRWAGQIPTHFGNPSIGSNFRTQLGKMLTAEAAAGPEQRPYIKNTNVQWDRFELDDLPTMSFDADERARCHLRAGDLLVCEGGEVGRSAIWLGGSEEIYFQKALHRVRPIVDGNTRYLMYCLWAASTMGAFDAEGNQSTIVHLTGEKLREHRIPWPPLDEQSRIVAIIDEARRRIDEVATRVRQQIELLREHRQALITAAVTGEMKVLGVA